MSVGMKRLLFSLILGVVAGMPFGVLAQSPCANLVVNSTSPPILPCDSNKIVDVNFNANININFPVNGTDTYSVSQIPYTPLPWVGTNSVLNNTDDFWSGVVQLPFPFCFFGNTYNSYVIGSNGRISFDTTLAGTFDAWPTQGPPIITAPDPLQNTMNNTIMAPYHDTDPSVGNATITWDTFGVAPCRTMVINWTSVPMFSCNTLIDSQQIVLYELSNVIDINIANKPICNTWNGGLALEGIQNANGTIAYTVPGRNNTIWTANNDSWRFEPAGTPYPFTTEYIWRNVITGNIIDTGANVTLVAPFPPGIAVEALIYGGCNTDTTFARDTTLFIQGEVEADFTVVDDSVCIGDPIVISNLSTLNNFPIPAPNLLVNTWDYGDGTVLINNNALHSYFYTTGGAYTITLSILDTVLGCTDTISYNVFVEATPYIAMTATPTEICVGETVAFKDSSAPHTISTTYNFDDGNVLLNIHNPRHTFENPGTYNVTFSGQYLVCPDPQIIVPIQVDEYPVVNLGPDVLYCPGLTDPIVLENLENTSQIMQWSDGTASPSLEVDAFGRFWAMAANNGCSTTDSIWIKRDCYLNIPNSFSPNGDGRNDYFIPRQLLSSGLQEFNMKIFNRWGELIFETDKLDGRGWDGKYGGKNQATGVFVYVIDAQWNNNYRNSFKGNVTLLR